MYLLIKAAPTGGDFCYLHEVALQELLDFPEKHGVERFLDEVPDTDPSQWREGTGLLFKVELLSPVKKVAWVLPEGEEPETMFPFKAPTDRLRATWLTRDGIIDTSEQSI